MGSSVAQTTLGIRSYTINDVYSVWKPYLGYQNFRTERKDDLNYGKCKFEERTNQNWKNHRN